MIGDRNPYDGKGNRAPQTREQGLREIETTEWEYDPRHAGSFNFRVHNETGHEIWAWLTLRPHYCDRGHIQLMIEGIRGLDGNDSFPRFFFSMREAKTHTILFLKWRLWKERVHPHTLTEEE